MARTIVTNLFFVNASAAADPTLVVPHLQLLRLRRKFIKCLQALRINPLSLLVNLGPLLQCQ